LFTEVNPERAFHHLTNRYTFIGRFALELRQSSSLISMVVLIHESILT
jgi:hypothetical protein